MKKVSLFILCVLCVTFFASCNKNDYKSFVGIWGVEKIEYYNIDYAGNPIAATIKTYNYDPQDIDHGIQLVFRDDQTGEMRDNDVDTVSIWNYDTEEFDSYVVNPDTTLITSFTYLYDKRESALTMKMKITYPYTRYKTFMINVYDLTDNSFIYENEYDVDYMERAHLKRLSNTAPKSASRSTKTTKRPHKPGSLLGSR